MSDSQKVTLSLDLLVESCNVAISALSEEPLDMADYPTSDFSTLRTDFLSLLSILYAATTKVALSLKPSAPHHKASLVPLKDLTNNVAALIHSVRLMRRQEGATVVQEYESKSQATILAIRSLAQTLQSSSSSSAASEEYLMKTGGIHEIIESARKSGLLSSNNREAVCKIWLQHHDSLVDGSEEIKEICEPQDTGGTDEEFDDGWEELGISSKEKLSSAEVGRAEKVKVTIKLGVLLHKRVINDFLSVTSPRKDNAVLDKLAGLSGKLLIVSDDLISSMYAPQDPTNVALCLDSFRDIIEGIRVTILPPQEKTLNEQLESLSISSTYQVVDKTSKWFIACFEQIDKATAGISTTLETPSDI